MAITMNGRSIEETVEMMEADFEDDFGQACDEWGWDGPDPDGEIAMERYYDAQATRRSWREPEWAR